MKLRKINLVRYRQFIDETLELDPSVTVVVGRNDTDKTGVLDHFFDQCVYERVIAGGNRPMVPGYESSPTEFALTWDISSEDYDQITFPPEFGSPGCHVLKISFRELSGAGKLWTCHMDGKELEAYENTQREGDLVLREAYRPRDILPTPWYVNVVGSPMQFFEMYPYDCLGGGAEREHRQQLKVEHRLLNREAKFLRLAGIRAYTRSPRGMNEPWSSPPWRVSDSVSTAGVERRLAVLSERMTEKLQRWWQDPPGLRLKIRLIPGSPHTYGLTWTLQDDRGLTYHSTGLLWFIGFLVEWLAIEDFPGPLLLLFDDPALPLHPGAQRAVAALFGSWSPRHQVIYSTHSPFLIDWNFPQRVRLFERDHGTKRTRIRNKPYAPHEAIQKIWDPLRESIGVSVGDVAILGARNLLVEGVSDQILIANASALSRERGQVHLRLPETSIVPYGDRASLDYLIRVARRAELRVVVLVDDDQEGDRIKKFCERERISSLNVREFCQARDGNKSIEDILDLDFYIDAVNDSYRQFEWFVPIDVRKVREEIGRKSLGLFLATLFDEQYERHFDKIGVMTSIVDKIGDFPQAVLERLQSLIERINSLITG
jgi:hypothetical protein